MTKIDHQLCALHAAREAVARCPLCGRFFCRECVTEHHGRMLCAACLAGQMNTRGVSLGRWRRWPATFLQGLAGWIFLGYAFYLLGQLLLSIPHDFHEGTLWRKDWLGLP